MGLGRSSRMVFPSILSCTFFRRRRRDSRILFRSPAKAHAPPAAVEAALPHDTRIYGDPQYPWEAYL